MAAEAPVQIGHDVKDLTLAEAGRKRIDGALQSMPVLQAIRKQFIKAQPLAGVRISACLPITHESANLLITLRDGGASVVACASDAAATDDEAAASLVRDYAISVYAVRGANNGTYGAHLMAAAEAKPQIVLDTGAELTQRLHSKRPDLASEVWGGSEDNTAGVIRLKPLAKAGELQFPIVAVGDALTRYLFVNRYGTGQSAIDAILRVTNILMAGLNVVIAGYGWCGRACAARARGLGANVIVTEVDPGRAVEALMDGYRVMTMADAVQAGDVFLTVTGNKNVIAREHFERIKNNAILCSAGYSGVEIDLEALGRMSSTRRSNREFVEEYTLKDGRRIHILGEGRPINAVAAGGHPATVMDMSFAIQTLTSEYLAKHHKTLERRIYPVPEALDRQVAKFKLESMHVSIDKLTIEQEQYLAAWSESV